MEITIERLSKKVVLDLIELIRSAPESLVSKELNIFKEDMVRTIKVGENLHRPSEIERAAKLLAEQESERRDKECFDMLNSAYELSCVNTPEHGEYVTEVIARVKYVKQSLKVVDDSLDALVQIAKKYELSCSRD